MCDQGFDLELRHNILSRLTHNNTFILVYFDRTVTTSSSSKFLWMLVNNVRTTPDSRRETRAHVAWKSSAGVHSSHQRFKVVGLNSATS
jgi:hypothetical protein